MGVIYLRTNLVNGMQYVGQTKDLTKRERAWHCLKWRYANQLLTEERNKYGLDRFETAVLKECDDSELDEWERYYINELGTLYPNGYNINIGGTTGFELSECTKKKISEANKGENHYLFGKHMPEDTRKKISVKLKGIPKTEEAKRKMSENSARFWLGKEAHNKGEKMSEEQRQKLIENGKKFRKKVYQCTLDNKLVAEYESRNEAARKTSFSKSCIGNCCSGGYYSKGKWINFNTYKGFKWMYEEDYEKMLAEQGC